MIVKFLTLGDNFKQRESGSIDSDGNVTGDVRDILKMKAVDPKNGSMFAREENPEKWLKCLQYTFTGSYFRATAPI